MAIFFATLLPQFVPGRGDSFAALFALGIVFCFMTLTWLTLYAIAVARARRLITGRVRRALDAATGLVLVALGLRLGPSPIDNAQKAMRDAPTMASAPFAKRTRAFPLPS